MAKLEVPPLPTAIPSPPPATTTDDRLPESPPPGPAEPTVVRVVESHRRLSESILFTAQRRYYDGAGIEAWRSDRIPHYVTSNPAYAHALAQIVAAYLRDCLDDPSDPANRPANDTGAPREPFYIVELGAGSGTFGFLFLRALTETCARWWPGEPLFRYVMTDFTESNLSFWRSHIPLQSFISEGVLDFALFDAERDAELSLRVAGERLSPGGLKRPIVVIANYVFDGIGMDAFAFAGGQLQESLVTVAADAGYVDMQARNVFSHIETTLEDRPASPDYYPEPELNRILANYAPLLEGDSLIFPIAAIRCVERLSRLSSGRLLLVSGDKGYSRLEDVKERGSGLAVHGGSFSLSVNFHAIGEWFLGRGGKVLSTPQEQLAIHTAAFLLGGPAGRARETDLAYYQAFEGGSCDDFFHLRQGIQPHYEQLDHEHLLALLRLSRHDPVILRDCIPRLASQIRGMTIAQRRELVRAVDRCWANYYHLREDDDHDLPFYLGTFFYWMEEHERALSLFEESLLLFGEDPRTHWNMALCLHALRRPDEAAARIAAAYALAPDFRPDSGVVWKDDQ